MGQTVDKTEADIAVEHAANLLGQHSPAVAGTGFRAWQRYDVSRLVKVDIPDK